MAGIGEMGEKSGTDCMKLRKRRPAREYRFLAPIAVRKATGTTSRGGKATPAPSAAPDELTATFDALSGRFENRDSYGFDLSTLLLTLAIGVVLIAGGLAADWWHDRGERLGYAKAWTDLEALRSENAPLVSARIEAETLALEPWISRVDQTYAADQTLKSVLADSQTSSHAMLGLFSINDEDRRTDSRLHLLLAAANGDRKAQVLLYRQAPAFSTDDEKTFEDLQKLNGGKGFFQLGRYYAPAQVRDDLTRKTEDELLREQTDADQHRLGFKESPEKAFRYMHVAVKCNVPDAYLWANRIAQKENMSSTRLARLRKEAEEEELAALLVRLGAPGAPVERDEFCAGRVLEERVQRIPARALLQGEKGQLMPLGKLVSQLSLPADQFAGWSASLGNTGFQPAYSAPAYTYAPAPASSYSVDGSKYYRDKSGTQIASAMPPVGIDLQNCSAQSTDPACLRAIDLKCNDDARYFFSLGDAEMSRGNLGGARTQFNRAISVGRACGSDYAVMASKRLGALNLTCEYDAVSLSRISAGTLENTNDGDVLDLRIRQRALRALGHYQDTIDGKYGPKTRDGVQSFQREFGFRETGDLTPVETVYLICGAAEIARDTDSYTALGIMYVTGFGVKQNTDLGLQWLKQAARAGDSDALYNLAILYGTGTVRSSYLICDVVENEEQADAYLEEAARAGHPVAERIVREFGGKSTAVRWQAIRAELGLEDGSTPAGSDIRLKELQDRLKKAGKGCPADGANG